MAVLPPVDLAAAVGADADAWLAGWRSDGRVTSAPLPLDDPLPEAMVSPSHPHTADDAAAKLPPLLVLGGLHDVFRDDAVDLASAWPGPADIVVGAWPHDLGLLSRHGTGDLRRHPGHQVRIGRLVTDWLDQVLGGDSGRVAIRVVALEGSGEWARPGMSGGAAVSIPLRAVRSQFTADPSSAHPSFLAPVDTATTLERSDVARFRSDLLEAPVDVVGRPAVHLSGLTATDPSGRAVDGPVDWAVRLVLHTADADRAETDARMLQLGHAVVRTTGPEASLEIPLVSRRLHSGARVELQVSAHQFPVYARDPQDGSEPLLATELHVADRAVGDAQITLPVGLPGRPPQEGPR